ncbi:MAG: cytochrome c biogenesis protein ResB [Dermabacter sp.]|nr:cytochrome c biogenesis protein ResB [Dermabacter sp.]
MRSRETVALPSLGPIGWARFLWRQLTSMQTALFLLMLLAIAAVPGSLYPQRSVNPTLTAQYLDNNGRWGEILDALGFFDVFSSPWFSAIYLLLFISLIGCVVPRLGVYLRGVRARPPRTPKRLTRFTGYTTLHVPGSGADVQERAYETLRRSRYRVDRIDESGGALSVSAERGYLREAGNLLFHFALLGVLIGVAGGYLTSYRGQVTVVEGQGFANSLTSYDSFEPGAWFNESELPPFRFTLDEFRAEFSTDGSNPQNFGLPTLFEADVTVEDPTAGTYSQTVRVNQPLDIDGTGVYLLGNGYAPVLTVRDPEGRIVADGPLITIPQDTHYTSQLVLKMPDARPEQMAIVGIFAPTGTIDEVRGPHSQYAGLVAPELYLTAHTGDLGLDGGVPQNVYQIDVAALEPVTGDGGTPVLMRLVPGESYTLPDGTSIEFTGIKRFAAFDIKRDPWQVFTLVMSLAAVTGLILSLFIPRRRLWVRVTPAGDGVTLEVAGLARSEDFRLETDVQELAQSLAPDDAAAGAKEESA